MAQGRKSSRRSRAVRGLPSIPGGRPLFKTVDHGPAVRLEGKSLGIAGERWIKPFFDANEPHLRRLGIATEIDVRLGLGLKLSPGSRIGAVPLLSPATRTVAAGLLVAPRFSWAGLGAVLGTIGFSTEPRLGGTFLVPGSSREVPAWLLAAPVVRRLEALLRHRKRGFVERAQIRQSPRGRVDWTAWASRQVPSGRLTDLPCHFSDPDDDPGLMASVRWTLARLDDELASFHEASAARLLRARIGNLQFEVGAGDMRRPANDFPVGGDGWVAEAMQAMGWVAEERGLGGARVLDGLSWDLPIDEVWEAWVDAFVTELAPRCGLVPMRRGQTTRRLNWKGRTHSMTMLIPDTGMSGAGRVLWFDAKYKAHLRLLSRHGWGGLEEATRDAHRADLHQALAYAAMESVDRVDSVLVYPDLTSEGSVQPGIASIAAGRRRVRLLLAGLPFGFRSPAQRETKLAEWSALFAG